MIDTNRLYPPPTHILWAVRTVANPSYLFNKTCLWYTDAPGGNKVILWQRIYNDKVDSYPQYGGKFFNFHIFIELLFSFMK